MCPHCKHQLSQLDLIPVFSWLALRGQCRYCGKPISVQYPIVELKTAALFVLSYIALAPHGFIGWLNFGFWLYFLIVLIILAVYDLKWYLLPDKALLPAMGVAIIWLVIKIGETGQLNVVYGPLLAAVAAGGFFYAIAALSGGRWMGGGDVKLVFLMGLLLGPAKTGVAMALAFNAAAIVGLTLISTKIKKRTDYIAFGPFLVAATIAAMLYGPAIINWYLRLTGLSYLAKVL